MIKFKEFNLRERADIVSLATECSKNLSAQSLIDYFHKSYRTKFENGKTILDTIIDKYYPNSSDRFRDMLSTMFIEYIFSFEGVIPSDSDKEDLRDLFIDFFVFHNDANQRVREEIIGMFDQWYDSKFGIKNSEQTDQK